MSHVCVFSHMQLGLHQIWSETFFDSRCEALRDEDINRPRAEAL